MKANIVIFDGRIEFDRNGNQTEGKDAAGDGPSHSVKGIISLEDRSMGRCPGPSASEDDKGLKRRA